MAGKTTYLEDALLRHIFRGESMPSLTNVHIGLYTSAPTDAGGGTEVSGGSYARVSVTRNTSNWAVPSSASPGQKTSNSADITFPESTASWGTVTHFGIFDASSSGNLLYWGALGTSRNVNASGITLKFATGDLVVSED